MFARTGFALGTALVLLASCIGAPDPARPLDVLSASTLPGEPHHLVVVKQPSTSAGILSPLAEQPMIEVRDVANDPVLKEGIQITAVPNDLTVEATNNVAITDASGIATFTGLTLGGHPGSYTLQFETSGLSPVPASAPTALSWTRAISAAVVSGFKLQGGIPNASVHEDRVWLIYSPPGGPSTGGHPEAWSTDGVTFHDTVPKSRFQDATMAATGLKPGDIIMRSDNPAGAGARRYFMRAFNPAIPFGRPQNIWGFLAADAHGPLTPLASAPVFTGTAADSGDIGVIDIVETRTGDWRMFYVARQGAPNNARTATSSDRGLTWTSEYDNPFNDKTLPATASNMNVDPAPFRLNDGTYLAVTMRAETLYVWNSWDGKRFTQQTGAFMTARDFVSIDPLATSGALGDPSIVYLPGTSTIYMYVGLGRVTPPGYVVAAQITVTP